MWCNLIRRKIRLNLSDQEIKSNQIRLNWLGQKQNLTKQSRIILLFMPMVHYLISCSFLYFLLFPSISIHFVLFVTSIFHCFFISILFLIFLSFPLHLLFAILSSHSTTGLLLSLSTHISKFMNRFQNCNISWVNFFFYIRIFSSSFHNFIQKLFVN